MVDPVELAAAIRAKKKKLLMGEPEMIGTSPVPDMNAQDIDDNKHAAYIKTMVGSEPQVNADVTMANEPDDEVLRGMDKARMARLSSYFDTLDMSA